MVPRLGGIAPGPLLTESSRHHAGDRGVSETPAWRYRAVYFVLCPLFVHLKIISVRPGRRRTAPLPEEWGDASSALWGVLVTLWHGLQLAYRPLAVIFNRLLHYREYVVLNLPGVRMR
nr:MAG TPA: hypothetical protein [Caudoviricetes sp.]